jgi:hypothetical protein
MLMSVSPEENSYEVMLYNSDGATRFWIDLSSFHTWWISVAPNIGALYLYTEMVGGVGFSVWNNGATLADPQSPSNAVMLHSAGSRYPTGMAGFWALTSDAGNITILGCKKGVKPDGN